MGFGFKIDYDKALAEDERVITCLELCIERKLFVDVLNAEALANEEVDLPYFDNAWHWATRTGTLDETLLPLLGVNLETLNEYIHWMQVVWNSYEDLTVPAPTRDGWQDRARAARERLWLDDLDINSEFPKSEEAAKASLKKAKASRARHRRNKKKFE